MKSRDNLLFPRENINTNVKNEKGWSRNPYFKTGQMEYEGSMRRKSLLAEGFEKLTHYKTLYQPCSSPDNQTDGDFLSSVVLNPHPKDWSLSEVSFKSSRIAFQISVSILFLVIYHELSAERLTPQPVLVVALITTAIGYIWYQCWNSQQVVKKKTRKPISPSTPTSDKRFELPVKPRLWDQFTKEHLRVSIVYLILSYQLAPTLRTLTDTISTDTIHATAVSMLSVHLLTCDYGINGFFVSKTISVNAAVIGSICLASRMSSDLHSMSLLTLAVQCFVLFPIFSPIIWDSSLNLILLISMTAFASFKVSSALFLTFTIVIFTVIVLFPLLFVVSLKFKENMYGPWDEAVLSHSHSKL